MPLDTRVVGPTTQPRKVKSADGTVLTAPSHWKLLPPGDAAATRRVKAGGPYWLVQVKKGRRTMSRGVWADAARIDEVTAALLIEREDPSYQKKLQASRTRRAKEQAQYAESFQESVFAYLNFSPRYKSLAEKMAKAISDHAVPVGSGTVARTKRISIERRAEAATIAWMRHQTTAYDSMVIPRVKGKRREVRRMLAQQSKRLLNGYRQGVAPTDCPLRASLLK